MLSLMVECGHKRMLGNFKAVTVDEIAVAESCDMPRVLLFRRQRREPNLVCGCRKMKEGQPRKDCFTCVCCLFFFVHSRFGTDVAVWLREFGQASYVSYDAPLSALKWLSSSWMP